MVAASIQLLDLGIKIVRFRGRVSIMDEAFALGPYPVEEPPESTDESDLEDLGVIPLFIGEPKGVTWLHSLSPLCRQPALEDI